MKKEFIRKNTRIWVWLFFVLCIVMLYLFKPEYFQLEILQKYVKQYLLIVTIIYFILITIRGVVFFPGTPLLLAGATIFDPTTAYLYNLFGIASSTAVVYYFARYLRLGQIIERKYTKKVEILKQKLQGKHLPILIGWSFFPLVPTDVIVFVASSLKVPVWKCVVGVLVGQSIIYFFYVFSFNLLVLKF